MIRAISCVILCASLSGCALDPVSLILAANSSMYTPPVADPMGGMTPENTGATPSAYRQFDCQELSAKLELHQDVMGKIHPSDTVGRTSLQWDIDAITTVMHEKKCFSSSSVATPPKKVTGTAPEVQKNIPKTPSEKTISEAAQPKETSDPYCFGLLQPVEGQSPPTFMTIPASTPAADVSYDVMAGRYRQLIALAHQVQPGVWHKDMSGPNCDVEAGLCTGDALRYIFGPSHMAMLFCESTKEESMKGFERLKASLTSPHVIEWSP